MDMRWQQQGDRKMHRTFRWAGLSLVFGLWSGAASAETGGLPPWHFGMTPQQVSAFADYGPYRAFGNGDVETYAGLFDGRKENVQFFFKEGKLARIGVYLYEGQDLKEAAKAWGRTYATLKSMFGDIELPDVHIVGEDKALTPEQVGAAGGANTEVTGKSQMAPIRQPADKFVFASLRRATTQGQVFYYVTVYYDPPRS